MNRVILVLVFLVIGCSAIQVQAVEKNCSMALAMEAEGVAGASGSKDWDAMHTAYTKYRACDDGAIAQGFSDGVVRLLANRWGDLPKLKTILEHDQGFWKFVDSHIDGTTNPDDLRAIISNNQNCSQYYTALCHKIQAAAKAALAEALE